MTIYLLIMQSQNAPLNFYKNGFIKIEKTFIFIISLGGGAFYMMKEYLISFLFSSMFQFGFYKCFHSSIPILVGSENAVSVLHTQSQDLNSSQDPPYRLSHSEAE